MPGEVGVDRKALQEAAAVHLLAAARAAKEWTKLDDEIEQLAVRRREAYERQRLALLAYSQFRLSTSEVWPHLIERDRPPRVVTVIDQYLQRRGRSTYEEPVPPSRKWATAAATCKEAGETHVHYREGVLHLHFGEDEAGPPDGPVIVSWAVAAESKEEPGA